MYKIFWLEWFKLMKRLAAWGVYFAFLGLTVIGYGGRYLYGKKTGNSQGLPDALPGVLTGGAMLAGGFAAVLLAVSVSNEFEWRTSRQNIIDGLSKNEWFSAKLLLILPICVMFYGTQVSVGATLAYVSTNAGDAHAYHPAATYILSVCGALTAMCSLD